MLRTGHQVLERRGPGSGARLGRRGVPAGASEGTTGFDSRAPTVARSPHEG